MQVFGIDRFQHFVFAQHAVGFDGMVQLGGLELRSCDVCQDHAVAPRKGQVACVRALGLRQLRVAFQGIDHLVRVLARLLQRVFHHLG